MTDIFATVQYNDKPTRVFPTDYVENIICGDSTSLMFFIPDNSIDLIITSPPYFVRKQYEKDWTLDDYVFLMRTILNQCYRVLKDGKYLVVNFGDYFNSNRFYESKIPSVYPASINYFNWGRNAGFDLQATRIWRKQFSRMGIPMIANKHPRPVFDYEHVWTFRKPNEDGKEFVNDRKKSQRGVIGEDWGSSAKLSNHEAAFPIELPLWAIDVYSKDTSDIVLDPFAGIGTTLLAAQLRMRRYIGFELDKEFCQKAYSRLQGN